MILSIQADIPVYVLLTTLEQGKCSPNSSSKDEGATRGLSKKTKEGAWFLLTRGVILFLYW